jgi:hypothetical protein
MRTGIGILYYTLAHGHGQTETGSTASGEGRDDRSADGREPPFYRRLNQFLCEHGFDDFTEAQCASFYAETMGRPSLPPGIHFRLLLIGYFEGIDSERGIAWRAADSLSSMTRHFDNVSTLARRGNARSISLRWRAPARPICKCDCRAILS